MEGERGKYDKHENKNQASIFLLKICELRTLIFKLWFASTLCRMSGESDRNRLWVLLVSLKVPEKGGECAKESRNCISGMYSGVLQD